MRRFIWMMALLPVFLLAACGSTDNTPKPTPLLELRNAISFEPGWRATLAAAGTARFAPDTDGSLVYAAAGDQSIVGFALADGRRQVEWRAEKPLGAGLGLGKGLLVVGTRKGELFAYDGQGVLKWNSQLSSEVIVPAVVADDMVLVRSVDGRIWGLSAENGKVLWQFQRNQPSLILRNHAPVAVSGRVVYAGLAGGRLVALSLQEGRVLWESAVAIPKGASELERVVDVTSAPVVDAGLVCAVAYQGRVACFAASNGSLQWARDISSHAGLALDSQSVYVSDDAGNIQAFDRTAGRNLWKQDKLLGRRVSGPAVFKGHVAVGDIEGVVHLLSAKDGSFLARQTTDRSAIRVPPKVQADRLIVQTSGGGLYAFVAD